jgi:hypothetical protein
VTLEPSPVSVTGDNYGVFSGPSTQNQRVSYAPLVNPAMNQYALSSTKTFVDSVITSQTQARMGASRIDGTIGAVGNTATISSKLYSYVESSLSSSSNQVLGRLKIELGASNFTWETRVPSPEQGRSFVGSLKTDPLATEDAPPELLAFHTYYFIFVYRATNTAQNAGGIGSDPYLNSARQIDLILNSLSGPIVPEPATGLVLAGLSLLAVGKQVRWRKLLRRS